MKTAFLFTLVVFIGCISNKSNPLEPIPEPGRGWTFIIEGDTTYAPTVELRQTFYATYPLIVQRLWPMASDTVILRFAADSLGTDYVTGIMFLPVTYFINRPEDTDVIVHEMVHTIQRIDYFRIPSWISEGNADFIRLRYGPRQTLHTHPPTAEERYDGYLDSNGVPRRREIVTARFFVWCEERLGIAVADSSFRAAMERRWDGNRFWPEQTGITLDSLWARYTADVWACEYDSN